MYKLLLFLFVLLSISVTGKADDDMNAKIEQKRQEIIAKALDAGVSQETIYNVFNELKYVPKVVNLDRKQPEFALSFENYMARLVTEARVKNARKYYFQHLKTLNKVAKEYDVSPHYLVALWGLETNFGMNLPKFKLANSLFSMAMDNRRSDFFTRELITALKIQERDGIDVVNTKSSWAGAFGQFQFMPSSYMRHALDYNKDGKIDIVGSMPDAFASAAHYLKTAGWKKGEKWGRPIKVPKDFNWYLHLEDKVLTVSEWKKLGIKNIKSGELPESNIKAKLVLPMGHEDLAFFAYHNFDVIYAWNHSLFYVIAVGYLADRIAMGEKIDFKSARASSLPIKKIKELQEGLCKLGFYKDKVDGSFGSRTRKALIAFQKAEKLPPDGYPSRKVLNKILKKVALLEEKGESFACEE